MKISDIYRKFSYITKNLNEMDLKIFEDIVFTKEKYISSYSLKPLIKMVKKYYNKNVILLIDEYDAPFKNSTILFIFVIGINVRN